MSLGWGENYTPSGSQRLCGVLSDERGDEHEFLLSLVIMSVPEDILCHHP